MGFLHFALVNSHVPLSRNVYQRQTYLNGAQNLISTLSNSFRNQLSSFNKTSPGDEASTFTFPSGLCAIREEQLRAMEDINKDGQLGLHQRLQLVLQQSYYVLQ